MKSLAFHPNIGAFDITDPKVLTFVIENKAFYWKFCAYLYNGFPEHDGFCSYEDGDKKSAIEDCSLYIANPLDLDLNTKANLNALYKMLKKRYFGELNGAVQQIQTELANICQEIKLDFDAELEMDAAIRVDDVFKLGGLRFEDNELSFLERLTKYVVVAKELRGISLVFINHIRDYLDSDQLQEFVKELQYRGITLINIESRMSEEKLAGEIRFVVDQDFCAIS